MTCRCGNNFCRIIQRCQYDDDLVGQMFKQYVRGLKSIQDSVNEQNEAIYARLEKHIQKWQRKYEVVQISDEIHCKEEMARLRKFASDRKSVV